jgi:superfamily I DNA and RNA helicase
MQALLDVKPTAAQLTFILKTQFGTEVIRGSAGSGKTTTALLRLRTFIDSFSQSKKRKRDTSPINGLVLTFNFKGVY